MAAASLEQFMLGPDGYDASSMLVIWLASFACSLMLPTPEELNSDQEFFDAIMEM